MPEDPGPELQELAAQLHTWLRFQRRLGWLGSPRPAPETPKAAAPPRAFRATLKEVREELGDCRRCKLSRSRGHLVFGEGSPQARLLFVGEGPGEDEDRQGRPFVGAAGQVLNNLIQKLGLVREEVYIANIVKCRPPQNRDPQPDEIASCLPFLEKQIRSIKPQVIVILGKVAAHALLGAKTPITKMRGNWQEYQGIRVMPTFHPSYLLRNIHERKKTWEDMQQVMEYLATHEED